MKRIDVVVAGAGGRGWGYSQFAKVHPERMRVVGVAEPDPFRRERMASKYDIPPENVFEDWKDLAARERFADAVIIATQDALHAEPAVAFANLGYHMLLEKPMAPNAADCKRIVEAAKANDIIFAVCHVLRYTPYTQALKELIDSGAIGEVVSIQHLEPVGYWHQAHSFVRGNWRNEAESSPMLLAKSCHDLDWIRYIMGARCEAVSSFGALKHFRKEEKPEGAGMRCVDCGYEPQCPYSAKWLYLTLVNHDPIGWPVDVITTDLTPEGVMAALESGPYGRCVYECDNDVVDNQVVNMQFEGGKTAGFTMTAFTSLGHRRTHIFGTRGQIYNEGAIIRHYDFLTDETKTIDADAIEASIRGGHGGGDYGLMDRFVRAVAEEDPSQILTGPDETLETHMMVFEAERARKEGTVAKLLEDREG